MAESAGVLTHHLCAPSVFTYTHAHIHTHTHTHTNLHRNTIQVLKSDSLCQWEPSHAHKCAHLLRTHTLTHAYTHTLKTHTHLHTHLHTLTHPCTYTYTYSYTYTFTYTYTHTYTYTQVGSEISLTASVGSPRRSEQQPSELVPESRKQLCDRCVCFLCECVCLCVRVHLPVCMHALMCAYVCA